MVVGWSGGIGTRYPKMRRRGLGIKICARVADQIGSAAMGYLQNRGGSGHEMHILVHTIDTIGVLRCIILTNLFILTIPRALSDQTALDGLALVHVGVKSPCGAPIRQFPPPTKKIFKAPSPSSVVRPTP